MLLVTILFGGNNCIYRLEQQHCINWQRTTSQQCHLKATNESLTINREKYCSLLNQTKLIRLKQWCACRPSFQAIFWEDDRYDLYVVIASVTVFQWILCRTTLKSPQNPLTIWDERRERKKIMICSYICINNLLLAF